jgi:hypothetical protein
MILRFIISSLKNSIKSKNLILVCDRFPYPLTSLNGSGYAITKSLG